MVGVGVVVVRAGGKHGLEAPIDGGGGVAVLPGGFGVVAVVCFGAQHAADAGGGMVLMNGESHWASGCWDVAAARIARRIKVWNKGSL